MDTLEIGKIVNTHGLRGEVKIVPWTDMPEVFEAISYAYIKGEKREIKSVKYQKNNIIVKFSGIDDINQAELLKNTVITTDREELGELPEGVYYITDLLGCEVVTDSGETVGTLSDVLPTGSNDVYVVKRDGKKDLLLPVIEQVVLDVNIEEKKITVNIMEGLEDL